MEVNLPSEEVPVELPEPALGINFARDGMNKKDWLSLVAIHCDCWLLSVAFYYAVGLNSVNREPKSAKIRVCISAAQVAVGMGIRIPLWQNPVQKLGDYMDKHTLEAMMIGEKHQ